MGFLKKIFGDGEEQEREDAARRAAAEHYAQEHAHGRQAGHEAPTAEKTAKTAAKKAAPAQPKAAAKKAAAPGKAAARAAEAHPHDPIPAQRTYAPLAGAPVAGAHTHVHEVAEGPVTVAHDQMMTLHIETHVPDHSPREDDPHYHLFEQAKARLKRQGLWKCIIADELCGGEPELHHTYIEFSQINDVDPRKLQEALGLHFDSDEAFQAWAESPGNLEVLCANHHRTHYGIHVIPGPLWEALRFRLVGTAAPAEFVTADEAADGAADGARKHAAAS